MYRKKLKELKYWIDNKNRKPLIIRGARQVGKSTLVKIFAKENNLDLLEINFERNSEYAELFSTNNPIEIIALLEISFNCEITDKTLLFLDEIQAEPHVLKCLRYFYEETPQFPIIAAGSLLDFELNSPSYSVPVGRLNFMYLQPMGFIEFLIAKGNQKLSNFIENFSIEFEIPKPIHNILLKEFKTFMLIGGMPEAVKVYIETNSFRKCEEVKHDLLATFQNDFAKYSKHHQYHLIRKIFSQIATNIGNKIKYSNLANDNKAADVANIINLLDSARVINKVMRSSANGVPLGAETNPKFFKIIFLDVGLVTTQLNLTIESFKIDDLLLINNGQLAEQWVGQSLLLNTKGNQRPELFYWAREKKSSSAEIDYVIQQQNNVVAIEVKAGKTGTLKSLHLFIKEKQSKIAIRFNTDVPSFSSVDKLLSLPLYLTEKTNDILQSMLAQK